MQIISLLVQTGASINPHDIGVKRLFFNSVIDGNFIITEKLISLGLDPLTVTDTHQRKLDRYISLSPDPDRLTAMTIPFLKN